MKFGYLVEFSKRNNIFGEGHNLQERQNIICSQAKLIELLQSKLMGTVWSAQWIDVKEYQMNHGDKLEEWGFEE